MVRAIWKERVIAESNATVMVEGNHYFPPGSVKKDYLIPTDTHTTCFWKGIAHYYTIDIDGERNVDAAWTYPDPKPAAKEIKGYIAFWRGVEVVE